MSWLFASHSGGQGYNSPWDYQIITRAEPDTARPFSFFSAQRRRYFRCLVIESISCRFILEQGAYTYRR